MCVCVCVCVCVGGGGVMWVCVCMCLYFFITCVVDFNYAGVVGGVASSDEPIILVFQPLLHFLQD